MQKTIGNYLLYLFAFSTLFIHAYAAEKAATKPEWQEDQLSWKEISNQDDIVVYEATERDPATGIIPLKVNAVLNYPIPRILSVLGNSDRKIEWVPKVKETKVVEQIGPYEKIEYARYISPWPFADRDFLVHIKGWQDEKNETVYIQMKSVDHSGMPTNKRFVRAETQIGNVMLKPVNGDKNKTFVQMTFLTNFKGNIPVWAVNFVQKKWPRGMMEKLTRQLEKNDIVVEEKYKFNLERS